MSFYPFSPLIVSYRLHGKLRHNSTSRKRTLRVDTRCVVRWAVTKSRGGRVGVMMTDNRLTRPATGRQTLESAELLIMLDI